MKRSSPNESQLVTAIVKALKLKGVFCWRQNSGVQRASYKGKERLIRMAEPGTPDILLALPVRSLHAGTDTVNTIPAHAMLCGLEVKTAKGKLSDSQLAWHARAGIHGVRVAVVRGVGEALAVVDAWRSGKAVAAERKAQQ